MLGAPSAQTLKHLVQSIMFFLKNLSTTSEISSPVIVAESGWQNRKCSSISLLLAIRIYARNCEERATSLLVANQIYARSCEKGATSVNSSDFQLKNLDSFSLMTIWTLTSFDNSTILR